MTILAHSPPKQAGEDEQRSKSAHLTHTDTYGLRERDEEEIQQHGADANHGDNDEKDSEDDSGDEMEEQGGLDDQAEPHIPHGYHTQHLSVHRLIYASPAQRHYCLSFAQAYSVSSMSPIDSAVWARPYLPFAGS